jgi:hypothetical protein
VLGRDPGVDSKPAAPAPGFGAINLQYRLACDGRVGRNPGRFTTGGAPVLISGTTGKTDGKYKKNSYKKSSHPENIPQGPWTLKYL